MVHPIALDGCWPMAFRMLLLLGLAVVVGLGGVAIACWASGVLQPAPVNQALILRSAYEDTARETVTHYRIALQRESKAELCVFAGMIASAYEREGDEGIALLWRQQAHADCMAAGMQDWSLR